ncbi:super-infection exclusion protein B [Achromobacter xylosoxidans]
MSDDVQGFFKLLFTSPKTVSLAVAAGLFSPYLVPEIIQLAQPYKAFAGMAGIAFLTVFLLFAGTTLFGIFKGHRGKRRAARAAIEGLSGDELMVVAAFVNHDRQVLVLPVSQPAVHKLWLKNVLISLETNHALQNFELTSWVRTLVMSDPELLRGADGDAWVKVDEESRDRLAEDAR